MKRDKSKKIKKYRIILLGEAGVGKTSLLNRYAQRKFSSQTTTTVGVDRVSIEVRVPKTTTTKDGNNNNNNNNQEDGSETIQLEVLDTSGCYKFGSLIKSYIGTVDAALLIYDITQKESFACLPLWNEMVNTGCEGRVDRPLVKLLVGNKRDLGANYREVQSRNAKNYADFEGMSAIEVSAKEYTTEGEDVFSRVVKQLMKRTIPTTKTTTATTTTTQPKQHSNLIKLSRFETSFQHRVEREGLWERFNSLLGNRSKNKNCVKNVILCGSEQQQQQRPRARTCSSVSNYVLNDYVTSLINY